jgi:hypothetical protein
MDKVSVVIVRNKDSAVVVEEIGGASPNRVTVPRDCVEIVSGVSGFISRENLDRGIPFGTPWEMAVHDRLLTSMDIASALRIGGIWTFDDFERNPQVVQSSLLSLLRSVMSEIRSSKKRLESRE